MRRVRAAGIVALAACLAPAAAHAKGGPTQALIEGPGLERPIVVDGSVSSGLPAAWALAEEAGFAAGAFGRPSDAPSALPRRPSTTLGPRYTITYLVEELGSRGSRVRQELYPYAAPVPVTYVPPGQPLWPSFGPPQRATVGGWYRTTRFFAERLIDLGIPPREPAAVVESGPPVRRAVLLAAGLGIVLGMAIVCRRRLRRPDQTSTVTASRSAS